MYITFDEINRMNAEALSREFYHAKGGHYKGSDRVKMRSLSKTKKSSKKRK